MYEIHFLGTQNLQHGKTVRLNCIQGIETVLKGHKRTDCAETFLFNLASGEEP